MKRPEEHNEGTSLIVGAVPDAVPKRRVRNVADVCVPFQLDLVDKHAVQETKSTPAPLRGQPRKFWKPEEVARLETLAATGMAPALIAAELGRSEMSVRHAARYRKIALTPIPKNKRRPRNDVTLPYKRRTWSDYDVALLGRMAKAGRTAAETAEKLGRTEAAVKLHAKKTNIQWRLILNR